MHLPSNKANRIATLFFGLTLFSTHSFAQAPVHVANVESNKIVDVIQISGSVVADYDANLSVEVAGMVRRIEKRMGDNAKQGDVLIRLDDTLARHSMEMSDANMREATIALYDAQRRLDELQQLQIKQSVAESTIRDLQANVKQREAALARSRAQWQRDSEIVARHQIKAPFDGIIARRMVDPGEWVSQGKTALQMVALDKLWLDFSIPESVLDKLDQESTLSYQLLQSSEQHDAYVRTIIPVADTQSRSVILRAEPKNNSGLFPGMAITGSLVIDTGKIGITVSRDAILRRTDGRRIVWTVERKDGLDIATENTIEVGRTMGNQVEILSGLTAGDTVVIRGNESLSPGQPVSKVN